MNAGWKNLIKNKGLSLRMCWHLGGVKGTRGWPGSEDMTIRAIAVEFRRKTVGPDQVEIGANGISTRVGDWGDRR